MGKNKIFIGVLASFWLASAVVLAGCHKSEFKQLKEEGMNAATPEEQIECFTKALNIWTDADGVQEKSKVYTKRGNAYSQKGHYDIAIGDYNRAIDLDPNNSEAVNGRANATAANDRANDIRAQQ